MVEEITKEFGADKLDTLWRENIDLVHVVTGNELWKEWRMIRMSKAGGHVALQSDDTFQQGVKIVYQLYLVI